MNSSNNFACFSYFENFSVLDLKCHFAVVDKPLKQISQMNSPLEQLHRRKKNCKQYRIVNILSSPFENQ